VATPGKSTVRYGGNTACVEIRAGNTRIIFDGGTGLRPLGQKLLDEYPVEAHLFFSHSHWDHIQGFPFFRPAFLAGNRFHIYGGVAPNGATMQQRLSDQMLHPNFPVPMQIMQADLQFYDLAVNDVITIGNDGVTVETAALNHPNTALGYRVNWRDRSVVYTTDTEHYPDRVDENLVRLCRNADILIYDACYTDEEFYDQHFPKVGWGHSTWQEALKLAEVAGVKQVLMFHHAPEHDDDFLDQVALQVKQHHPQSMMAKEGMVLSLHV
jgi:phosphoribosyl 1,2-cyclic phosphodiesterase